MIFKLLSAKVVKKEQKSVIFADMVEAKRLLVGILLLIGSVSYAQTDSFTILFWNLENYFDPFDDPLTDDNEFTPQGGKHWSWRRFEQKRNIISKVIISTCETIGDFPTIVAVAEVENRMVLRQLLKNTPLSKIDYDIIHFETTDSRGIDQALLYRKSRFSPLKSEQIKVPSQDMGSIREVLKVRGVLIATGDTIDIFVCHAPSKWGGAKVSSPRREALCKVLRESIDTLLEQTPDETVIVTGDFNDSPVSKALKLLEGRLENLALPLYLQGKGTIKYRGEWELIDQFLFHSSSFSAKMKIVEKDYLLERDRTYQGMKPFRTFQGPKYNGGASDHLPIILYLEKKL